MIHTDPETVTISATYDGRRVQAAQIADGLRDQKDLLNRYILQKQKVNDYHGIADAAMDIREIEAKLELLAELGLL